ncbi:MAG: LiaF transmembrane domain-containing protein [Christensenellales bacterium]
MKNRLSHVLWGLFFIAIGIGIGGQIFKLWDFNLFFDGWWTLFIIVPCFISIIQQGFNVANSFGLTVGVLLLLWKQNVLKGLPFPEILLPLFLVFIGLSFLFRKNYHTVKTAVGGVVGKEGVPTYTAVFSGQNVRVDNEEFVGANINAVFGGAELDLRTAKITQDVVINASVVFGGAEIFAPGSVKIKVSSTPIFGGVTNKAISAKEDGAFTIYVNATCIFGGVEIK